MSIFLWRISIKLKALREQAIIKEIFKILKNGWARTKLRVGLKKENKK